MSRRTLSALTNTNPNFTIEIDHFQTDKQTDAQTNNERFILNTPLLIAADNTVCPPPKVAADPPPLKKKGSDSPTFPSHFTSTCVPYPLIPTAVVHSSLCAQSSPVC